MVLIRQCLLSVGTVFLKPSARGSEKEIAGVYVLWGKDPVIWEVLHKAGL